jgi:carboxypeptidase family protein
VKLKAATALGALLMLASFCQAQGTGALKIVVTDRQGAAIPRASVHVAGARAVNLVADAHGIALAPGLTPGDCSITVSARGFAPKEIPAVTVVTNKTKVVELKLEETYTEFPIRTYDTLQPRAYSKFLNFLHEPALCPGAAPAHTESYRFIWVPAFADKIFMKVDLAPGGQAILRVVALSGGDDWRHVKSDSTRTLLPDERATLSTTLADIGFWSLPARVEFTDPYHIYLDGTDWAVEGVKNGTCHAVSRYASPLTDVFGEYFLGAVAKLKPYDKAF